MIQSNPPPQRKKLAYVCDKELVHRYLMISSVKDSYIFSIKVKAKPITLVKEAIKLE